MGGRRLIYAFYCMAAVCFTSNACLAQAQNEKIKSGGIGTALDCTEAQVNFEDDPSLTKAERSALMDKALFESLSKFELCQQSNSMNGAAGGGPGASEGEGGSGVGGSASVANKSMSGTEASPIEEKPGQGNTQSDSWSDSDGGAAAKAVADEPSGADPTAEKLGNGKVPDDIPSADNDSALESQIRQAAINEKNPETKAKLWEEYRKYKGLPSVKSK